VKRKKEVKKVASEFSLLGLGISGWITGVLALILVVATGYLFIAQVISALRKYMDRYLGDHTLSNAIVKLVSISVMVSALSIGFAALDMEYISPVLSPMLNVAVAAMGYLRWGTYIAAILFVGFAIYHHANRVAGPAPVQTQQVQQAPQQNQEQQQY